jgi:exodeoxyribonuclease VII small subunit
MADSNAPDAPSDGSVDHLAEGYAAAQRELEDLLADLEDDALDVDLLAAKVARASELIRFCRARIAAARVQVDRIVADLESLPAEPDDTDDPNGR